MKPSSKYLVGLCVTVFSLFLVGNVVKAADKLVFDSTDNYLGACRLTNKSEWVLEDPINVTTFEVWYSWSQGESELPVKVFKDGEKFAEFTAVRGSCDPYQAQWCNADYKINKVFPAGTYTTEIPTSKQCLKPGGTGAIRLYSEDSPKEPAAEEVVPVNTSTGSAAAPVVTEKQTQVCSCTQLPTIITAAGTSILVSFLLSLLLRRK